MLSCVMSCRVVLCHVVLCHVVSCRVVLCCVVLCRVMLCHVVLCSGPGGRRSVQSSGCGLLGASRVVLAARDVLRGSIDRSIITSGVLFNLNRFYRVTFWSHVWYWCCDDSETDVTFHRLSHSFVFAHLQQNIVIEYNNHDVKFIHFWCGWRFINLQERSGCWQHQDVFIISVIMNRMAVIVKQD